MNNLCTLLFLVALVSGQSVDEIPDISSVSQQEQQESLQDIEETAGAGNGETGSWGLLQAFMSINYENSFRVSVYQKSPEMLQFYYSPALIIDPSSAISSFNSFTNRHEMIFKVLMWDAAFEKFVHEKISQKVKVELPESSVSILPIGQIRIDAEELTEGFQVINRRIPYISQPSTFQFRFVCSTKAVCNQLAELVKVNPSQFVSDLTVYYDLQNERIFGDKDNTAKKVDEEPMKSIWSGTEIASRINVLDSYSSNGSILHCGAEVYQMKQELLSLMSTINSTLTNSTLDLDEKVKQLDWLPDTKETIMRVISRENGPCNGTALRVTGSTAQFHSENAPNGRVCIGNAASPSPSNNFLVFNKTGSELNFWGTQSLRKGFTDFTPYVTWSIPASQVCAGFGNCDKLPSHLRGNINGGEFGFCSKAYPFGTVQLLCYLWHDALVDDDGAITVLSTFNETLWY